MRILMLGWELPPYNSGGLGVACYQLCKALSKKGADIEFILPYEADHGIDFMKVTSAYPQGVKTIIQTGGAYDSYKYIYEDGHTEEVGIYTQQERYERGVASLVRDRGEEFDIIHAHDWLTFRAALRAKEFARCPIVLHVHSIERDRAGGGRGNPMVRSIEEIGFLIADRIVAISQHTKDMIMEDYGIPADKIEVVHNSIDAEDLTPLEGENAYPYLKAMKSSGHRVVVNIGRLTIQKGLPSLLYAAREVVDRVPKAIFLVVGSGEQYYELIDLAAELGLVKNFIFVNFQRGKRWRDAYAIGDLFVMPSISEPFGLTALEAVGYGTATLVSKQSGVAEVLNNSLKVDFWDTHELANKIVAVMQNDELRDELHKNAYVELERMTWGDTADKLLRLFEGQRSGVAA
jgi:glycosyltransferase involved in cell wall biosynthesis